MTDAHYDSLESALRQAALVLGQTDRQQALTNLERWSIQAVLPPDMPKGRYQMVFGSILEQGEAAKQVEELIDTAFYLTMVATLHTEPRDAAETQIVRVDDRTDELLNQAGQILEAVTRCPMEAVRALLHRFYLSAAVNYQVSKYVAKSWTMANRFRKQVSSKLSAPFATPLQQYHYEVQRVIACFLMRDLDQAQHISEEGIFAAKDRLATWINQEVEAERIGVYDVSRFVAAYNIVVGIAHFARFLQTGQESSAEEAFRLLNEAELISGEAHLTSDLRLASMLKLAMLRTRQRSIWQQLGKIPGLSRAYMDHLVDSGDRERPVYELWESQMRAIQQGILDWPLIDSPGEEQVPRHFVISMQPGAGKSLIAEMVIVRFLSAPSSQLCLYITPTRILVEQVLEDFRKRLRRVGLLPASSASAALSLADAMGIYDSHILISTPEKLNSLLARRYDESSHWSRLLAPEKVKLIIVDEAHLIAAQNVRGILLEMLLLRLRHLYPHARIVFQSAVIGNPDSISSWLNRKSAKAADSAIKVDDWAPTDLVYAVLRRDGIVEYESGVEVQALARKDMRDATMPPVQLALKYCLPRKLMTLIFVSAKGRASKIATSIAASRSEVDHSRPSPSLEDLIAVVEREFNALGVNLSQPEPEEEFSLVACLRKRVAFHHAGLPSTIRTGIEHAVREGGIDIIVATTTLAEGVNLPVSCVIIADLYLFDPETRKRAPIPKMLVRNIAGRAGRPYQDTRGEVIIVQPRPNKKAEDGRTLSLAKGYWCRYSEDVEPIKSSLYQLCREVEPSPRTKLNGRLARVYQAQLLAAVQEGAIDTSGPHDLVGQTLLFHEKPSKNAREEMIAYTHAVNTLRAHTRAQLSYIMDQVASEELRTLQRTGFSAKTCADLLKRVEDNTSANHQYYKLYQIGRNGQNEQLVRSRDVLSMAFLPFEPHYKKVDEVSVLTDWISGDSVSTLASRYFREEGSTEYDDILSCQDYVEQRLKMYAAWGLRGFVDLLRYWKQRKNPEVEYTSVVELLPRYAAYGVNHPVAVYLQDMRALNREEALIASKAFELTHRLAYNAREDFLQTRDWLGHPDRDAIHQVVDQAEEAERIYGRLVAYSMPELEQGAMDFYIEGLTA